MKPIVQEVSHMCAACGEVKPLSEYPRYANKCKVCFEGGVPKMKNWKKIVAADTQKRARLDSAQKLEETGVCLIQLAVQLRG